MKIDTWLCAAAGWHPGSQIKASPQATATELSTGCCKGDVGAITTKLVLLKGSSVAESIGATNTPGGYSCCTSSTIRSQQHLQWCIALEKQQWVHLLAREYWSCTSSTNLPESARRKQTSPKVLSVSALGRHWPACCTPGMDQPISRPLRHRSKPPL